MLKPFRSVLRFLPLLLIAASPGAVAADLPWLQPSSGPGPACAAKDFAPFHEPEARQLYCPAGFCDDDNDCACSAAVSWRCAGEFCEYNYGGGNPGGGNPGGGGPLCPSQFCAHDYQCYCPGYIGVCVNQEYCQFS